MGEILKTDDICKHFIVFGLLKIKKATFKHIGKTKTTSLISLALTINHS